VREPDATFSDPRQAVLYDGFNNDRSDLAAYVRIADDVKAHRVVDVGCGTGSLAIRLAELGFSVTGGSTTIGEEIMRSTSTLRFRERDELERDLSRHGFNVLDVHDAPDRPGKEMVFLTQVRDGDDDKTATGPEATSNRRSRRPSTALDGQRTAPLDVTYKITGGEDGPKAQHLTMDLGDKSYRQDGYQYA
jgi:hypothetical protein